MKLHFILLGTVVAIALSACSNTNKTTSAVPTLANATEVQRPQVTVKNSDYDSLAVSALSSITDVLLTCQKQIVNAGDLPDGNLPSAKDLVLAKINTTEYNFKKNRLCT